MWFEVEGLRGWGQVLAGVRSTVRRDTGDIIKPRVPAPPLPFPGTAVLVRKATSFLQDTSIMPGAFYASIKTL